MTGLGQNGGQRCAGAEHTRDQWASRFWHMTLKSPERPSWGALRLVLSGEPIDGLVQERCNFIANALKLHLSCTNPSIWRQSVTGTMSETNLLPPAAGCELNADAMVYSIVTSSPCRYYTDGGNKQKACIYGMNKLLHPTVFCVCDYISMP